MGKHDKKSAKKQKQKKVETVKEETKSNAPKNKEEKAEIKSSETKKEKEVKTQTKNNELKKEKAKIESKEPKKEKTKNNKKKIILLIVLSVILLASVAYLAYYFWQSAQHDNELGELQEFIAQENEEQPVSRTEKVLELQKENPDIKAWMEIAGTDINYPVLQTTDNEYYLTHNYKKEEDRYGSAYFHKDAVIDDTNSNLIIYGHNMQSGGGMFHALLDYQKEEFYQNHKTVQLITDKEEREYEIMAVFLSKVFYKSDRNVFRYYNYTSFDTETEFQEYIQNVDKIKLYDTGVTANYGDQLITMITCEYSQENGRLVVVAKRVK